MWITGHAYIKAVAFKKNEGLEQVRIPLGVLSWKVSYMIVSIF